MLKNLCKGSLYVFLVFLISGCTARAYVQDKERVDQEDTGNAGYIMGTKQPVDRSNFKKTRRHYVLEIEKKDKNVEKVIETKSAPAPSAASLEAREPGVFMPEEPIVEEADTGGFAEYTVQEGDTLQKISKRFYDTYRKWEKIYEANKDTLKNNPNRIKPGMVLMIPRE